MQSSALQSLRSDQMVNHVQCKVLNVLAMWWDQMVWPCEMPAKLMCATGQRVNVHRSQDKSREVVCFSLLPMISEWRTIGVWRLCSWSTIFNAREINVLCRTAWPTKLVSPYLHCSISSQLCKSEPSFFCFLQLQEYFRCTLDSCIPGAVHICILRQPE